MGVAWASGDLALFVCARCQRELPYKESRADGDKGAAVRVCLREGCWDRLDPWKLPPRQMEAISLQYPRPDVQLTGPIQTYWDSSWYWDDSWQWDELSVTQQENPLSEP